MSLSLISESDLLKRLLVAATVVNPMHVPIITGQDSIGTTTVYTNPARRHLGAPRLPAYHNGVRVYPHYQRRVEASPTQDNIVAALNTLPHQHDEPNLT